MENIGSLGILIPYIYSLKVESFQTRTLMNCRLAQCVSGSSYYLYLTGTSEKSQDLRNVINLESLHPEEVW